MKNVWHAVVLGAVIALSSGTAMATEWGRITQINVAGPDDPNHPNVVQIVIEGQYKNVPGCNASFAAIRNTADRKDMIAFAISAYLSGQVINLELNPKDAYLGDRCTISRISGNQ